MHNQVSITTGLLIMQNRAVVGSFSHIYLISHYVKFVECDKSSQAQEQRGAANGLSMCSMSFFKTIGPAAGGSL